MATRLSDIFFALLRAGMWEQDVQILPYGPVDFDAIYEMASDQTVIGQIGAGMEHITDTKVEKMKARPFLTWVIAQEQQNTAMNEFIGWLFGRLKEEGITAVLVKGQGVAQCYSRPNWRACGDVDLLLDVENYNEAKKVLSPLAASTESEDLFKQHKALEIGGFDVELHGSLRTYVSKEINRGTDAVQEEMFKGKRFRYWDNSGVPVALPCQDDDVIFIFNHILGHFFVGGIGFRQICDWCRLLWTYRKSLDLRLLESRIKGMGLMSEWKAFAALAVDYLGMPASAMPLYSPDRRWSRKASRIVSYIFDTGNFGHNRDMSHLSRYPSIVRSFLRAWSHFKDNLRICRIFPLDTPKFFLYYLTSKTGKTVGRLTVNG